MDVPHHTQWHDCSLKTNQHNKCWQGIAEIKTSIHPSGMQQLVSMENSMIIPQKIRHRIIILS